MKTISPTYLNFFLTARATRTFCVVLLPLLISLAVKAQVGIGTVTPDESAQLEIKSSDKGILIPRIDKTARDGISPAATGLLIYQTNETPGFYYYDGSVWKLIGTDKPVAGFSARVSTVSVSANTTLTNYSVTDPSYTATGFNASTGQYTVPETGKYAISATINYQLTTTVNASLGTGVNPYFRVVRTSPIVTPLITGYLPVFDVNIALVLNLRTVLRNATVTLSGNAILSAGDVIGLQYDANGFTNMVNIGGDLIPGVVWSVTKL